MWRLLREHFGQARWRRQVPLRHFICDFVSHALRIVIEVDGGQHSAEADRERTRLIEAEGYRVVRFWNAEILENPQGCFDKLVSLVRHDHPLPGCASGHARKLRHPSPIVGEGW